MSSTEPTWEERVTALRSKYDDLREKMELADVTQTLGDITTEIAGLPGKIAGLRERRYAFAGYLERKAEVLAQQWGEVRQQVQQAVRQEVERAQQQVGELEDMWKRIEGQWSDKGKEQSFHLLETSIDNALTAIEGAHGRIEGLYGQVPTNVDQTTSQIAQIEGYLKMADEAVVDWTPTEALVMIHEGEWRRTGKDKEDPDGVIILTDQRLIFEQNEKVGGRLGFGGEKVHEVLLAIPVGHITKAEAEKKGMLGGIDLINLELSQGDHREITLEVKGGIDCKWYAQQLNRVISGEISSERAIPADAAAEEAVHSAPTVCPTCGATLPALVRGVTELVCDYCGTKVRV